MIRQRTLFTEVRQHLSHKAYSIITGARQVGKTSLLRLLFHELQEAGASVFFLSMEDPRLLQAVDEHPENLLKFFAAHPTPILEGTQAAPIYLLLDEIQYTKNPTNLLKYLFDKYEENLKIIATGSSAFYLDRKFKDSLAGRKRIFHLYPLSFEEFLSFKNQAGLNEEISLLKNRPAYVSPQQSVLTQLFYEYLTFGGYPAVVLENGVSEKTYLLTELKNAYLKRDVLESRIDKESKFYLLLQLLADQTGNLVNKQELGSTVGVDAKTIENYLYVLQKCFHIELIRPFYRNLRKELTKMPKVYFNDLGLRNAMLNRFGEVDQRGDKGALLENYYFLQFRHSFPLDQIRFWRTTQQQEVDFVIEESFDKGQAFEIKWNPAVFSPAKYHRFQESYPGFSLSCLGATDFYQW